MDEGRSDRNLYAQGAPEAGPGGVRASAPTLGSKCRDLPGGKAGGGRQWTAGVGRGRGQAEEMCLEEKAYLGGFHAGRAAARACVRMHACMHISVSLSHTRTLSLSLWLFLDLALALSLSGSLSRSRARRARALSLSPGWTCSDITLCLPRGG
jgi:hypothetical protein